MSVRYFVYRNLQQGGVKADFGRLIKRLLQPRFRAIVTMRLYQATNCMGYVNVTKYL